MHADQGLLDSLSREVQEGRKLISNGDQGKFEHWVSRVANIFRSAFPDGNHLAAAWLGLTDEDTYFGFEVFDTAAVAAGIGRRLSWIGETIKKYSPPAMSSRHQNDGYDRAQVCINGHLITESAVRHPEFKQAFCSTCGDKTIEQCPACENPIQGGYFPDTSGCPYAVPAYCLNCGQAFPWTAARIQTAIELATEDPSLSEDEKKLFAAAISDVVRDTPRTQLGAARINRLLVTMGKATGNAIRDVIVDIVSETVKKVIWPDRPSK